MLRSHIQYQDIIVDNAVKKLIIEVNQNLNYCKYTTHLLGNIRSMLSINQLVRLYKESNYLELSQKSELSLHKECIQLKFETLQ